MMIFLLLTVMKIQFLRKQQEEEEGEELQHSPPLLLLLPEVSSQSGRVSQARPVLGPVREIKNKCLSQTVMMTCWVLCSYIEMSDNIVL